MSGELDSIHNDEDQKKVIIDPRKLVEEWGFLVLDQTDFSACQQKISDNTSWQLFETLDVDALTPHLETEGRIILDPMLDPDPFGNHGVPLHDRLAAMGWPADRKLYLERQEPPRAEDLL